MRIRTIPLLIVVALLLVSRPGQTEESFTEINLVAGSYFQNIASPDFDFFSDNDWQLGASLVAEVEVLDELFVLGGVGLVMMEGRVLDYWNTSVWFWEPVLGVRKGVSITQWFRPYVLAMASLAFSSTDFDSDSGVSLSQDDLLWGGRAGLGAEFILPRSLFRGSDIASGVLDQFTLGLGVEGGYIYRQEAALDRIKGSSDSDIVDGNHPLGTLNLHGWYLAVDLRVYF